MPRHVPTRRRIARAAVAVLVLLACAAFATAQAPAQEGPSLVTVSFRAVTSEGQPVLDLAPEDVTVKLDGRAREVQALQLVRFERGPGSAADAPARPHPAPFATNAFSDSGRNVVMVLDDESFPPGREPFVKTAMSEMLAGLSPLDSVALVTVPIGGANVDPTADHGAVRAAIDQTRGRAPRSETAVDAACRTLANLDRLKTLFSRVTGAPYVTVVFFSGGVMPPGYDGVERMSNPTGACEVRPRHLQEIQLAATASLADFHAVHIVDDSGSGSGRATELLAGLEHLAGLTGNPLTRLTGSTGQAMARLVEETSAHYVATFEVEASERNEASHRLDVGTGRAGVQVRARPELLLSRRGPQPPRATSPSANEMLRVPDAFRDLPLRAGAYASRNAGDDRVKLVVLFEPIDAAVQLKAAEIGLFVAQGRMRAQWKPQAGELARTPVVAALAAPTGSYRLRLAAVDGAGRAGAVDQSIQVALTRSGPVTFSDLLLGASEGGTFVPRLQFGSEATVVPYLEIYGAARNAEMTAEIDLVAAADRRILASAPAALLPSREDGPRVMLGELPIASLPPGDYLVSATLSLDGREVGRVTRTLRKARR